MQKEPFVPFEDVYITGKLIFYHEIPCNKTGINTY